jgi:PKD repeat protein
MKKAKSRVGSFLEIINSLNPPNQSMQTTKMKKTQIRGLVTSIIAGLLILAGLAGSASANTISWHVDNGNGPLAAANFAGVNLVSNWTVVTGTGTASSLKDNSNATTTAGIVSSQQQSYGIWRMSSTTPAQDSDGSYNKRMINPYINAGGWTSTAISGIPYARYSIYVYFSSDTAGRTGTVSDGTTTYTFTTIGPSSISGGTATLTQTAATSGNPSANYAVFTNETSSSKTITCTVASGGGISSVQIVDTTPASYISLSADTTASPSTNVYVGSTVTFSASFIGTQPITNQWNVNSGSGFVPITGATNSTLTLTNLQLTNSGAAYALFASNLAGSSNSTPVTLSVFALPTNSLGINVQFTGSWLGSGNAPTQTGSAVIGGGADVWNAVSNPTGGTSPAGLARGTNLVLFDTGNITTPITMDYVADYVFNGTAFGFSNPFKTAGSPYANLMSGYMGSVTTTTVDTNTITLRHLVPGVYNLYLYVCGRSDGQTRVDMFSAKNQNGVVCGPNNGNNSLISGVNYVHLMPTVTTNGVLNISCYGTTDAGQGLLNGFQLNGPDTNVSLTLSSDTSCDSPLNDYVGRTVTFSAAFAGFPTPSLQWEVDKGGGYVTISGATNSALTLTNLQTTDSGNYALFAANAAGALNSTPLTLNVQTLPSPLAINVQFDGTTYTGTHATTQVGGAVIGGGSDYWNPVSNPNPVGADTNLIFGSLVLSDVNNYGTPISLTYTGANQDYNNGNNTPFNSSGSPAANLMQASLVTLNSNTANVTLHGVPAGVYDLYLYSCASSSQQQIVTRFSANDAYDTSGPNDANNVLTLETNYVHLTPTVTANGLLTISFAGRANGQGNLNGVQLSGPGATLLPPVANFSGSPTNIYATQSVTFTDYSSGNITNWIWNFGDGNTLNTTSSASVNHAYALPGSYAVTLIVTGAGGSATNAQTDYIVVNSPPAFGTTLLSGGDLILSGTGGIAGNQYRILTATNLTQPLASWTPVSTNVFASDGSYSYTNSLLTNAASFFRLVTP